MKMFRRQWPGRPETDPEGAEEFPPVVPAPQPPQDAALPAPVDPWQGRPTEVLPEAPPPSPREEASPPPETAPEPPEPPAEPTVEPDAESNAKPAAEARQEPVDLPGNAPTIGRASQPQLGVVKPGMMLRPPAVSLDGTTAGRFHIAAASFIGSGHLQTGVPRQDAYNFMPGKSGRLYVAIADGLGSKPASQLGAHLFAESVLFAAADAEAGEDGTAAGPTASDLLRAASRRAAGMVTDAYRIGTRAAEFVGAVAVFSERGCDIARVGDVSAFTLEKGEFTEAFEPDAGLVNIVSASMPGEDESEVEEATLQPGAVVVLGTDGLANDLRNSGTLREWLAEQWQVPHLPFGFGDTLRYRRQGSHDDRTAVVVWRPALGDDTGDADGD